MSTRRHTFILGSRSPRRLELLRLLVPDESIRVLPPLSPHEAGFDGLREWPGIQQRLRAIAREKCDDVLKQLQAEQPRDLSESVVVTADTIIVVEEEDGGLRVLGQPPTDDSWRKLVRGWFVRYYFGRRHTAATAFCAATADGRIAQRLVTSRVMMHRADAESEKLLDWYLDTGEPRGKAGGYALQGAGGVFVSGVEGSVSNVVGLPLRELLSAFVEIGIDVSASRHGNDPSQVVMA